MLLSKEGQGGLLLGCKSQIEKAHSPCFVQRGPKASRKACSKSQQNMNCLFSSSATILWLQISISHIKPMLPDFRKRPNHLLLGLPAISFSLSLHTSRISWAARVLVSTCRCWYCGRLLQRSGVLGAYIWGYRLQVDSEHILHYMWSDCPLDTGI